MKPKKLLYKRATAAEILDESISSLIRMEQEGRLTPVILRPNGVVHYRAEDIEALAKPRSDIERKKPPQSKPKIQRRILGTR